ncbi:MAG: tRNA pseudouridine(55) synthase TruB [Filifactoraceae bacterium]
MYNGFINVLKPSGMTSHDVVGKIRYLTKVKRVGHTGTLDPNAAGVLPICIGAATKFSDYIMEKDKTYIGEICFGVETTTLDSYGKIVKKTEVPIISSKIIEEVLEEFRGESHQIPPKYSAIKINGKKLYELAREEKEMPEIRARKIVIHDIELLEYNSPKILIKVSCSSGTYIRTLAFDISKRIGERIGVELVGILSLLIRTKAGSMNIEDSTRLEDLEKQILENNLVTIDVDKVLNKMCMLEIKDTALKSYINGAVLSQKAIELDNPPVGKIKVYNNKNFLGVGEATVRDGNWGLKSKTLYQVL